MEAQNVDMFIMSKGKFFPDNQIPQIREELLKLDESLWPAIQTMQLYDPTTSIIVSLLAGGLGIDRFIIGDTGVGIGKLLTCGGLGIWTIIDWFMIMDDTKVKNLNKLKMALQGAQGVRQ